MSKEKTSIVFTGDIGFDRYMDKKWEDEQLLSSSVLEFFHSADHVCANVEGALIEVQDDGSHGDYFHSMNPAVTGVFRKMGTDIWCIGNNHTMDAGVDGLQSTCKLAAEMGVKTFGAGLDLTAASEPVYLDEAGGIGMFGVCYMNGCTPATATDAGIFRWDAMEEIALRIAEIKATCRWCVVVSHGGEEFSSMPLPYTRDRYLKYLELGADVVVGHHPHVPENYELFENGKAIFYSLGNFIFDTDYQRVHPYTDQGVLLKLIFTEDTIEFDAVGTRIDRQTERIDTAPLPGIFTNIPAEEYALLAPLSAKAFIIEDMKKMVFLHPERYADAPSSVWGAYFYSEDTDGFCAGAHMDLNVVHPFAQTAKNGDWKRSKLETVKEHIIRQL